MRELLITDDMSWKDIALDLCETTNDAMELIEAAQSVRDQRYAEEHDRLINRHAEPEQLRLFD